MKIQWPEPLNNLLWNSNKGGGFIHNDENHKYSILQKAFIKPRIDFTEDSFQEIIKIYAGILVLDQLIICRRFSEYASSPLSNCSKYRFWSISNNLKVYQKQNDMHMRHMSHVT